MSIMTTMGGCGPSDRFYAAMDDQHERECEDAEDVEYDEEYEVDDED